MRASMPRRPSRNVNIQLLTLPTLGSQASLPLKFQSASYVPMALSNLNSKGCDITHDKDNHVRPRMRAVTWSESRLGLLPLTGRKRRSGRSRWHRQRPGRALPPTRHVARVAEIQALYEWRVFRSERLDYSSNTISSCFEVSFERHGHGCS